MTTVKLVWLPIVLSLAGCSSNVPKRIHPPGVDANAAGRAAVEQYDANGDGKIDAAELEIAASLLSAMATLDTDGDGAVSAEEVAARIRKWQDDKVGLMGVDCQVSYQGRPLAGATLIFEPEEFLGGSVTACTGTTGNAGKATLSIPDAPHKLQGAAPGFYRIKITSPSVEIPAKYNTETTLGREIASDVASGTVGVQLNLRK